MQVVTVGRGPNNDVIIKDDYMVERCHVQFKKDGRGRYSVVDFQTQGGTYVNGKRIRGEVRIQHGDKVRIAQTDLPWESYFPDDDRAVGAAGGWSTWSVVLVSLGGLVTLIIVILLSLHIVGVCNSKKGSISVDALGVVGIEEYINDSLTRQLLVENLLDSINNSRSNGKSLGKGQKRSVKPKGGSKDDVEEVVAEYVVAIPVDPSTQDEEMDTVIFHIVEQMPEFPGGDSALFKFVSDNVKYPAIAQENGVQGRAVCQFTIEKDGTVANIHVVKSAGDKWLDKESIRVLNTMPKWKPGQQRGKPVRVSYTIPINFRLL